MKNIISYTLFFTGIILIVFASFLIYGAGMVEAGSIIYWRNIGIAASFIAMAVILITTTKENI